MVKLKVDDNLIRITLLIIFLFILYNFILLPLGFLRPICLNFNDTMFGVFQNIKRKPEQIKEIVVAQIDEKTLIGTEKKWPWDRTFFAEVIEKIKNYNPKLIGIDITFFGESTTPEEDNRLAEAINRAKNIILPSYITEKGEYVTPYDSLLTAAYGCGFVNKITDMDYKIRRARLVYKDPFSLKTQFAFEIILAAAYFSIPLDTIIYTGDSIILNKNFVIPIDKKGTIYIDYLPIRYIPAVSLIDLLQDKTQLKDFLKDKIILMGQASKALHDIHQTPEGLAPGVLINAFTLNTILKKIFIRDIPNSMRLPVVLILLLLTTFLTYRSSISKGFLYLCIENLFIVIIFFIISFHNFKTDYFSLLILVASCYFITSVYKYSYLLYANNKLKRMVITDSITGLSTPRYFQFKLQLDLSKPGEAKTGISIVIFDVPEFQELFKKYPREQIELILRQLSLILKQNSRKKVDLLSRWKEDRFAGILLKTDIKDAQIYCQKIISKIEENEFILPDTAIHLKIYAGISNYPAVKTESARSLISCAEAACSRSRLSLEKICIFNMQEDKIHIDIFKRESLAKEEDYLAMDIAEREKELLETLNELKKSQQDIQKAHFETILSLVKALEEKDTYTAGHSERVAKYSVGIAKQIGLDESEIKLIKESALLHDIGKFGLPDKILHKKEALLDSEIEQIKKHPVMGQRILEKSKFFENHIPLILHHHERYDGKGYPHGLSGKFIPRGAQIISLADSVDAMTTGRGYNHVLNIEETIEELKKSQGTQFDPDYIKSAIDYLTRKP